MKEYIVTRDGIDLTMRLSAETAKRLRARPVTRPEPEDPDAGKPGGRVKGKRRSPANKARTPSNKGA